MHINLCVCGGARIEETEDIVKVIACTSFPLHIPMRFRDRVRHSNMVCSLLEADFNPLATEKIQEIHDEISQCILLWAK